MVFTFDNHLYRNLVFHYKIFKKEWIPLKMLQNRLFPKFSYSEKYREHMRRQKQTTLKRVDKRYELMLRSVLKKKTK